MSFNIPGATLFINEPNEEEILGYFVIKDGVKIEFRNISTIGRLFHEGQKTSWLKELDYPNSKRRVVAIPYFEWINVHTSNTYVWLCKFVSQYNKNGRQWKMELELRLKKSLMCYIMEKNTIKFFLSFLEDRYFVNRWKNLSLALILELGDARWKPVF